MPKAVHGIIAVTTREFGRYDSAPRNLLASSGYEIRYSQLGREPRDDEETFHLLSGAVGAVVGTEAYGRELINSLPDLLVLSRVGVGLDSVDMAACKDAGVMVTYTPTAPSQSVAEHALGLILSLCRNTMICDRAIRTGRWNRPMGFLMEELTIGILGVGRIGSRLIGLLRPFGCRVLGCDIKLDRGLSDRFQMDWVDMASLFSRSDIISIHVPLNEMNYHLVGGKELGEFRGFLVNTSRGAVVDTMAVELALENGLAGYAADVFEEEPYSGPLASRDNTILTSHVASNTRRGRYLMEIGAAEDCLRVLAGNTPRNPAPYTELSE